MGVPKEKRLEYFLDGLRRGVEIKVLARELGIPANSLFAYKSGFLFFGLLDDVLKENPNCTKSKELLLERQQFLDDYLTKNWKNGDIKEILKDTGFNSRVVLENFIRRRRKNGIPIPPREYVAKNMYTAHSDSEKPAEPKLKEKRPAEQKVPPLKAKIESKPVKPPVEKKEQPKKEKAKDPPARLLPVPKPKPNPQPIIEEVVKMPQKSPEPSRQPVITGEIKDGELIPRGPKALDNPDEPGSKVNLPDLEKLYGKPNPPKSPGSTSLPHETRRMTFDDLARINRIRHEKTEKEIEDEAQELRDRIKESQQE